MRVKDNALKLNKKHVLQNIIYLLNYHQEPLVRGQAAITLSMLGYKDIYRHLEGCVKYVEDDDEKVRYLAALALFGSNLHRQLLIKELAVCLAR